LAENSISADAYCKPFLVIGKKKVKKFIWHNPTIDVNFIYSKEKVTLKTQCSPGLRKIIKEQM
jgi:thiamine biosynthesis lipoprotein ApbE